MLLAHYTHNFKPIVLKILINDAQIFNPLCPRF